MAILYGIKNCDTVKKARQWLDQRQHIYQFHDFRADGLDEASLNFWIDKAGKDTLINKRSTTWKQLADADKAAFEGDPLSDDALQVIMQSPTLLKRPILKVDGKVLVGFKENEYQNLFN